MDPHPPYYPPPLFGDPRRGCQIQAAFQIADGLKKAKPPPQKRYAVSDPAEPKAKAKSASTKIDLAVRTVSWAGVNCLKTPCG